MSTGDRIPLEKGVEAYKIIERILRKGCARIEPAGSIRRERETIGDIEIVCVPAPMTDLFGKEFYTAGYLEALLREAGFREFVKNGELYKQFFFERYQVNVDLFITTPPQWGLILALRTGPAEWSHRLVTKRNRGGLCPSWMTVQDGRLWDGQGNAIDTYEEADVFRAMGLEWVEPKERA